MKLQRPTRRAIPTKAVRALLLCVLIHGGFGGLRLAAAQASKTASPGLAEAKMQLAHQDLAGAEKSLWTVLSADPNDQEALTLLGVIRGKQQRYPEAEALFRRILQINPKSAEGHRNLGKILAVQNKMPDAIAELKAAGDLAPHDIGLKVERANLYAANGQFPEALTVLDAIPSAKFPLDAIRVKAACLVSEGKATEADHLVDQARGSPATELDLAEVFLDGNLPDKALRALDVASQGFKQRPPRFYSLKGRALAAKGQVIPARTALNQALAGDPHSSEALITLAEIDSAENKHVDAVEVLKKAQARNPDSLLILRHLVEEATKAGDTKAALEAASALSERSPNNAEDLYLSGAAMLNQNVQGASSILEKYVALRPENAKGWMGLGIAYVQQERYSQAREPLEKALSLDPTLAEAEYELAIVAKNDGKLDEAIRHLERAQQLQPNHVNALRMLGNLYLAMGQLEKARAALERAEAIDPNNMRTEYDLGLVLNKLGETELARQHMEQFQKLKAAQATDRHD